MVNADKALVLLLWIRLRRVEREVRALRATSSDEYEDDDGKDSTTESLLSSAAAAVDMTSPPRKRHAATATEKATLSKGSTVNNPNSAINSKQVHLLCRQSCQETRFCQVLAL